MTTTQRNWFEWTKTRLGEAALAVFIVFLVIQFKGQMDLRAKQAIPASAWFEVNEIFVPDHRVGENPEILYDRTIREDFRGFFVAEVQRMEDSGLWFAACSGSGASDYDTSDVIPNRTVTWEWFLNRECAVDPGVYRLRVSWEMKRVGWPTKTTVALSNTFTVR